MVSAKKTPEAKAAVKAESHGDQGAVGRPRRSTKGKQRPSYRRRVKPPYSYAELITMAIRTSPDDMMTLREIVDHMSSRYECFRGSYVGWKNSVRHNLSANECFVKVLRNTKRPYGKDNFWTVKSGCAECMMGSAFQQPLGTTTVDSASSPPGTPPHLACCDAPSPALSSPIPSSAVPRFWPSPTPGSTPSAEPLVPTTVDQSFDDWSQLDDLFRPDTDLDLALYKEGLDFADSHQAFAPFPDIPEYPLPDHPVIKTKAVSPPPDHSHHPAFKTEPSTPPPPCSSVVHPYGATFYQRGIPSYPLAHLPLFPSRQTSECYCRSSSCVYNSGRPQRSGGVAGHGFRQRGDGFGLGSIVASAIRGSLSLDLDESALQAIERSVRLLDQPRSADLSYV